MKRHLKLLIIIGLAICYSTTIAPALAVQPKQAAAKQARAKRAAAPRMAHMVYFNLKEDNATARKTLVDSCHKHLSGHEGVLQFSIGTRATDMTGGVNVVDFDVSLNLVFKNKAAHDTYNTHPRHLKFIAENKDSWAGVRVFDSYLTRAPRQAQAKLPKDGAKFVGLVEGTVKKSTPRGIVLEISSIKRVWRTNKAKNAKSLVGKTVFVVARREEGKPAANVARFLRTLKAGQTVTLDVANRRGQTLSVLELLEDQRAAVAK